MKAVKERRMSTKERRKQAVFKHPMFTHITTNMVTLLCAYFVFAANVAGDKTHMLDAAMRQVNEQNTEIIELRGLLVDAQLKIISLEAKLADDISESKLLSEYLDALPFPAWVKRYRVADGKFVMHIINDSYTAKFGVTSRPYIGQTDFDVHPRGLALKYQDSDLRVIRTQQPDRRVQHVEKADGTMIEMIVYKFPINLEGDEVAVGGIAIGSENVGQ